MSRVRSVVCTAPGTSAASSFWAAEFAPTRLATGLGSASGHHTRENSERDDEHVCKLATAANGGRSNQNVRTPSFA